MTARRSLLAFALVLTCASAAWAQTSDLAPVTASPGSGARLIFGQTGRPLAKGESYFVSHMLFFVPVARTGITDRVSLAVGAPGFSTMLIGPKFQIHSSERVSVAAGGDYIWAPTVNSHVGYAYVVATAELPEGAVTVALGQTYGHGGRGPVLFSLGAEKRMSPKVIWITENYFGRDGVMTSGGFRVHGPTKFVEFVMAFTIAADIVFPMPVLNFGWRF